MNDHQQTASELAEAAYPAVFRTDFSQPGFVLFNLGPECGSHQQRQPMVLLKRELARRDHHYRGRTLYYQSLGRFDQQVTTKPHRDGGPDESVLMLGYEPTDVESRFSLQDYSQCAFDIGLTPAEFLDHHNPMFPDSQNRLQKYTTRATMKRGRTAPLLLLLERSDRRSPSGSALRNLLAVSDPCIDNVRWKLFTQLCGVGRPWIRTRSGRDSDLSMTFLIV
ncbi:MAG: hypothetical protein ACYTGL_26900 [Planctomycetota bacterium]|jgi:hypothetical protein